MYLLKVTKVIFNDYSVLDLKTLFYRIIGCKATLFMSFHAYLFPTYFSWVLTVVCPVRLSLYLDYNLKTEKHDILFIEILNFQHTCSILID